MVNIPLHNTAIYQSYLNKQRKDKFVMIFNLPEVLKAIKNKVTRSNNTIIPDTMQFSIYGNIIPDIAVPEKEVPYSGQVLKVSSLARPSYTKNTVNFTVDNMFNNYWVIYKWLQVFNDEKRSVYDSEVINDKGTLGHYQTNISVYGLDEYNNRVIEFKYYHAFPINLGGITYSDRDGGELESSFDFTYHQFEAILL